MYKSPRILMIAPLCYPPGNPEAYVNANLVLAALDAGWHVDVVTMADPDHWYPNDLRPWQKLESCVVTIINKNRTLINRLSAVVNTFGQSSHIIAGGRWALPAVNAAIRLTSGKKYDFIISRALPPSAHLAALILSRRTGIPWIANWNDPFPFKKFPRPYGGGGGKYPSLGFWTERYFREVAERAAWHTFPCERLRNYVASYLPADIMGKSSVVPHIALGNKTTNGSRRTGFTLMYAGTLRPPRSPRVFLQGIRIFIDRVKPQHEISAVFMVDDPEEVRNMAIEHNVEKYIRISRTCSYTEMPAILETADVLVVIEALFDEGIFLPSKFVDYVQVGRPILAISPSVGTLSDIINTHGGGIAVDGKCAEAVADALCVFYTEWLKDTLKSKYGSSVLYPLFSKENVLNEYVNIFTKLQKS